MLLIAMTFAAFGAQATTYHYHFKRIDSRFDAIAERLNQLDFENRRADTNPNDLQQLSQIAKKQPQLQARPLLASADDAAQRAACHVYQDTEES